MSTRATCAGWLSTLPYLASQENMFSCLRHRPIGGRYYQDATIHLQQQSSSYSITLRTPQPPLARSGSAATHLSCAGDHVLHIIGMAWAVDMGIMPAVCLILDCNDRNLVSRHLSALAATM